MALRLSNQQPQTAYQTWVQQELNGEAPRSYNNAAPTWSPDGSRIAFLTDRTGQWEIRVMHSDGSNQQPLSSAGILAEAGILLSYNGVDEQVLSWRKKARFGMKDTKTRTLESVFNCAA